MGSYDYYQPYNQSYGIDSSYTNNYQQYPSYATQSLGYYSPTSQPTTTANSQNSKVEGILSRL